MNGPQDLGGQMGFGPVAPEKDEPRFHEDWEKAALGLTLACGAMGHWTIDESRHARESLPPAIYYGSSYYEIWTRALTALLIRHGFITAQEAASGHALTPRKKPNRTLAVQDVAAVLAKGGPTARALDAHSRFREGDRVRTIVINPESHTRLPRYARGKLGVIDRVHEPHVFPDTNAHGGGENPQWLYSVAFEAGELWGRDADPTLTVSIDAWESYLEPA